MTRVRWTPEAAADLTRIVDRIRKDNPAGSERAAKTGGNQETKYLLLASRHQSRITGVESGEGG